MNSEFFTRLYRGYAAEHHISGLLFARSYEVFRLPADFGLDLVVTDRLRVAQGDDADAKSFPFALQVKSRWLRQEDIVVGPNGRPETTFTYRFKWSDLDVLNQQKNAALVFVFYWPAHCAHTFRPQFFMIHTSAIGRLASDRFFRQDGGDCSFTVRFRALPSYTRDEFVAELCACCTEARSAEATLRKMLPAEFERNWKAEEYFQFARLRKDDTDSLVFKSVWGLATDFSLFPSFPEFGIAP